MPSEHSSNSNGGFIIRKKSILNTFAFVLILAALLVSGCADKKVSTTSQISLTGEVVHETYYNEYAPGYKELTSQFIINVDIQRPEGPLAYDEMRIAFDPGKGEEYIKEASSTTDLEKTQIEIEMGEMTWDLFQEAEGNNVSLHIGFFKDGKLLESFTTELPTPGNLNGRTAELPSGGSATLTFVRD